MGESGEGMTALNYEATVYFNCFHCKLLKSHCHHASYPSSNPPFSLHVPTFPLSVSYFPRSLIHSHFLSPSPPLTSSHHALPLLFTFHPSYVRYFLLPYIHYLTLLAPLSLFLPFMYPLFLSLSLPPLPSFSSHSV